MESQHKARKERPYCPYCDEEIAELAYPYCQACELTIFYCPKCKEPFPRENKVCPRCGAEIKDQKS